MKFLPIDISDEDTINDVLIQIDTAIQYGEDFEPKEIPVREILFHNYVLFLINKGNVNNYFNTKCKKVTGFNI